VVAKPQGREQQGRFGKKQLEVRGVDDLVMLPKISEADILDNLKKRYLADVIYVSIFFFRRFNLFSRCSSPSLPFYLDV
jgi:myosin heavy subunit